MRVILSPMAEIDLSDVLIFTSETWGEDQSFEYRRRLESGIENLGNHPQIGKLMTEYGPILRRYPIDRHVLYYRIAGNVIEVVRVLHIRSDHFRMLTD